MGLNKKAKKHFTRQAPDLIAAGTLTDGTLAEFIQLCKVQALTDDLADQLYNGDDSVFHKTKYLDAKKKLQVSVKESEISKIYRQYLKQQAELKRFFKFEPKPPPDKKTKSKIGAMMD